MVYPVAFAAQHDVPAGLQTDVERRVLGHQVPDKRLVTEPSIEDQSRPEAEPVSEVLQAVDDVTGEGLEPPAGLHRRPEVPGPRRTGGAAVRRDVQGVRRLDHARDGPSSAGLDCADEGNDPVHVTVIDIDVAGRLDEVEGVEDLAELLSEPMVGQQAFGLPTGGVGIGDDHPSVACGALERAQGVGLHPKVELMLPLWGDLG
ncbi:MAG: hypothetical protein JWP06_208 [Candidatus Saccharibacteria bacterium]|nr:hypothetical protein [Candidatus Saccharibacteria bacterium]